MLCTETQTRKVQKVETSNTMLLMPPADVPERPEKCARFAAAGAATFMYETEVTGPRVDQLRALLSRCPYRGAKSATSSDDNQRCTMAELSERVQASVAEINVRNLRLARRRPPTRYRHATNTPPTHLRSSSSLAPTVQSTRRPHPPPQQEGLITLDAIEIDGRWCIVEPAVLTETFGAVLDAILGEYRYCL